MKKRTFILLALIALCLMVFFGYRAFDHMRTDKTPPVITIAPEPVELSVNAPKGILLQDVTAMDDTSGDVTDSLVLESIRLLNRDGKIAVGYAAFDDAGNVAKVQREVMYNNYKSPRFTLSGPLVYAYDDNFDILNEIGAKDSLSIGIRTFAIQADSILDGETQVNTDGTIGKETLEKIYEIYALQNDRT